MVGLVVVSDEGGQRVLTNTFGDTESHDYVHLGKVSIKFLLCHLVDTADDVFIRLTDCFANSLEIPWMTRCSDGVPSLHLPLVTLFTLLQRAFALIFFAMSINSVCLAGLPTCRLPTNLPYLKKPHEHMRASVADSATS